MTTADEVKSLAALARDVVLTKEIQSLIAKLVLATHPTKKDSPERVVRYVKHGASPRAALALALGLKARALMSGRPHCERSDLPYIFKPALRHRIALNFEGEAEGLSSDQILDDVLDAVPLR